MIYCYCNFFGNTFKVYLKDEKLDLDEDPKIISFNEIKEFIENIDKVEVKGIYLFEINNLINLLDIFELLEKKIYNTKQVKLFLTLRNFSMCSTKGYYYE